ncbi:MAG: glycosyltransferase family 9 protein [Kiritimatiellae bacterium]|jgi:ADP-heptose:LPS heptosyltransferase|nr:glycosyltransferase family 9 protein [Kiritimatiellia bacterium]
MIKIYNIINIILLRLARLVVRQNKNTNSEKSFLIIRLDAIGDMVLFSAFMREFREQEPDAKITLVISPLVKNLYENCPYADKILYFDGRKPIKPKLVSSTFRAMFWGIKNLKGDLYTTALLPRHDTDAEGALMLAITSKCPKIISFSEHQTKERAIVNRGFDKFIIQEFVTGKLQHEVETNLDFLRKMGYTNIDNNDIEIWLSKNNNEPNKIKTLLAEKSITKQDLLIGIGFSASMQSKCWPQESFVELFKLIHQEYPDSKLLLIGGPGDIKQAKELQSKYPHTISFTGLLSLRETAALLKQCSIYIGNDSGPMHIAAAMKTPTIEILNCPIANNNTNSNSPLRFGPWKNVHHILQPEKPLPPCKNLCSQNKPHCITQITVQQLFDKTQALLLKTGVIGYSL